MEYQGTLWEERAGRPLDIYPAFRALDAKDTMRKPFPSVGENRYRVTQTFLTIETDKARTRNSHTQIGVIIPYTDYFRGIQFVDASHFGNHIFLVMRRNSDNPIIEQKTIFIVLKSV